MKKHLAILIGVVTPLLANATGMAVNLNNLYLQNFTSKDVKVTIKNLPENESQLLVPSRGICKVDKDLMFLPPENPESGNSASYEIMISTPTTSNPIVMDKFGITMASDSFIQAHYSGNVKQYSFFGFCGDKYSQYKFLNVIPHDNESAAPDFRLVNCANQSNFVYLINDQYIKVKNKQKKIDFSRVKPCQIINAK